MTLTCVSITGETVQAAKDEITAAEEAGADLIELRLDHLGAGENWQDLMSFGKLDRIVTNRAAWEGGKSTEDEGIRLSKLIQAGSLGADFIDVELKAFETFQALLQGKEKPCRIILSHHDFEKTPSQSELGEIYAKMNKAGADICKIAVTAQDITDCVPVFKLLQAVMTATIALSMTERGVLTRLLAAKYGSYLTFATTASERASAPGQPSLADLLSLFRFQSIEAFTDVYGIIGNPVSHSMSPAIHNAAFKKRKLDAVYVPLLVDDVGQFLTTFNEFKFKGFSITIPHKENALKYVDLVDDVAGRIGAINTIVRLKDGRLKGYNTDWMAAIGAVERALLSMNPTVDPNAPLRIREEVDERPLEGKHVVLLGAGGAARGMAFGAVDRGAQRLTIVNRTLARAQKLVDEMSTMGKSCTCTAITPGDLSSGGAGEFDVVMNSTSIGMHPKEDETPIDEALLKPSMVVFDAVYTPRRTRFLAEAEGVGCKTVDGVEMFVGQALKQYELWTGTEPPRSVMEAAILERLNKK